METLLLFIFGFILTVGTILLIIGFVKILDWFIDHAYTKMGIAFATVVFAIIGGLVMAFGS